LKFWKKNKDIPLELAIKSDAFSFGLSILEIGNLISYKNIKINKDQKLLNDQLLTFSKRYPKIIKIIKPFLI